jgi:hypothetical protein
MRYAIFGALILSLGLLGASIPASAIGKRKCYLEGGLAERCDSGLRGLRREI